jgi:hypothetical protein
MPPNPYCYRSLIAYMRALFALIELYNYIKISYLTGALDLELPRIAQLRSQRGAGRRQLLETAQRTRRWDWVMCSALSLT